MDEERLLLERGPASGTWPICLGMIRRAGDRVHRVVIQADGVKARVPGPFERMIAASSTSPTRVFQMRPGVDVDVQKRVPLAQLAQPGEQPLAAEHGQHAQPAAAEAR